MPNRLSIFVILCLIAFAGFRAVPAWGQSVPFVPLHQNASGADAVNLSTTATIVGYTFAPGDYIGLFTDAGLCAGVAPVSFTPTPSFTVAALSDQAFSTADTTGFRTGMPIRVRVWQASTNTVFAVNSVVFINVFGNGGIFGNAIHIISSLSGFTPIGRFSLTTASTTVCAGGVAQIMLQQAQPATASIASITWESRRFIGTPANILPFSVAQQGSTTLSLSITDSTDVQVRVISNGVPTLLRLPRPLVPISRPVPQLTLSSTTIAGFGTLQAFLTNSTGATVTWTAQNGTLLSQTTTSAQIQITAGQTASVSAQIQFPDCSFTTTLQVQVLPVASLQLSTTSLTSIIGGSTIAGVSVAFQALRSAITLISNNVPVVFQPSAITSTATSPAALTATFTPTVAGTTTVTIQAIGTGISTSATIVLQVIPSQPTGLIPSGDTYVSTGETTLSWTSINGVTLYEVRISTTASYLNTTFFTTTSTSLLAPTSISATQYFWSVRAVSGALTGSWSADATIRTLGVPTASVPTLGGFASATGTTLSWSAVSDATLYEVRISTTASYLNTTFFTTTATSLFASLSPETTYWWSIRARTATAIGAWSGNSTFATVPLVVPPTIAPTLILPIAGATVYTLRPQLVWSTVPNSTQYELEVRRSGESAFVAISSTPTIYNFVSDLAYSTEYLWRVRAVNTGGNGPWSEERTFYTAPPPPAMPNIIAPANGSIGITTPVVFTWQNISGVGIQYSVEISTTADFTVVSDAATNLSLPTFTSTSAIYQPLQQYYWRVRASNPSGNSPWTTAAVFRIRGEQPILLSPADNAIGITTGEQFTWTTNTLTVTQSTVYIAGDNLLQNIIYSISTTGATTTLGATLQPDTDYFWIVASSSIFGDTARSAMRQFRSRLATPQILHPLSGATNVITQPQLRWRAVSSAEIYDISLTVDGITSTFSLADTVLLTPELPRGAVIQWSVSARNNAGNNGPAALATFTTRGVIEDIPFAFNGTVHALAYAGGDSLFVGGEFTAIGKPAEGLAVSDSVGNYIATLPSVQGTVRAIVPDGNGGYFIGGDFTHVGGLARTNLAHITAGGGISEWNPGANGSVRALVFAEGKVFIGGEFSQVQGVTSQGLAVAVPQSNEVRALPTNGAVYSLLRDENRLYIGGNFTFFGTIGRNRLAVINPQTEALLPLAVTPNNSVRAMTVLNNRLYIGGDFTQVNTVPVGNVIALDKQTLSTLSGWQASTLNGRVNALTVLQGRLFVGGDFSGFLTAFDATNGARIPGFQSQLNGSVYALTGDGLSLFVGGGFTQARGNTRRYGVAVSAFDGATLPWNPRFGDTVFALSRQQNTLISGGKFTFVEAAERQRIALINSATKTLLPWTANISGTVRALAVGPNIIAVGGDFTAVNNQARGYFAGFQRNSGALVNGTPLFNAPVLALTRSWQHIAVGGNFTSADGFARGYLALADGSTGTLLTWQADCNAPVFSFASNDTALFIGGDFTQVQNQARSRIARLSPQTAALHSWSPAINGRVSALHLTADNTLIVGGTFSQVNTVTSGNLAVLSTTTATVLTALPSPNGTITSLTSFEDILTVGGAFSSVGSAPRANIAAINVQAGSVRSWRISPNAEVRTMVAQRRLLVAGGAFTRTDGITTPHLLFLQRDIDTLSAPILVSPEQFAENVVLAPHLQWRDTRSAAFYTVQYSSSPTFTSSTVQLVERDTTLRLSNLSSATSYYWRVRAFNSLDTSAWSEIRSFRTRECVDTLRITSAPSDTLVCPGRDITLSVSAQGIGLQYQWERNGVSINGATSASYTILASSGTVAGNYNVIVNNSCGDAIRSSTAIVSILPTQGITLQPVSQEACIGSSVTFRAGISGGNSRIQWLRNNVAVAGATSATYTITSVTAGNAGLYRAEFTTECGDVLATTTALLTVDDNLPRIISFRTEPSTATICAGEDVRLIVEAEGRGLVYSWRRDGVEIPGVTGSSIILQNVQVTSGGVYQVSVSVSIRNICNQTTASTPLSLTIVEPAAITQEPTARPSYCQGDSLRLEALASGTNRTFSWLKDGVPLLGENTPTLRRISLSASDAGVYRLIVSGDCNSADTSVPVVVDVAQTTALSEQPRDTTVLQDSIVVFSINAVGNNLLYQWQRNGMDLADTGVFRGTTSRTFRILSADTSYNGTYRCRVTGTCGSATSNGAVLTVITRSADFSYVVSPQRLDFERVKLNQNRRLNVNIRNTGTQELTFTNVIVTGADSLLFTIIPPISFTVPSGVERALDIDFRPTSIGAKNASLRFFSNAVQDLTVTLTGEGESDITPTQYVRLFDEDGTTPIDTLVFENIYDPTRDFDKGYSMQNITTEQITIDSVQYIVQQPATPPIPAIQDFTPYPRTLNLNGQMFVDTQLKKAPGMSLNYMSGVFRVHVRGKGFDEFRMRAGIVPNSVEEQRYPAGSVYPNPARDKATAVFSAPEGMPYSIEIVSLLGIPMLNDSGLGTGAKTSHTFKTASLPSGTYSIVIRYQSSVIILPLVVVR